MTSHELAQELLKTENLPVIINGWGSDEGLGPFEVTVIDKPNMNTFVGPNQHPDKDSLGYSLNKLCIALNYSE